MNTVMMDCGGIDRRESIGVGRGSKLRVAGYERAEALTTRVERPTSDDDLDIPIAVRHIVGAMSRLLGFYSRK
jgi:hypothetical protein